MTLEQLLEELDDMATIYGPKVEVRIDLEENGLYDIGHIGRHINAVTIGVRT